MDTTGLIVAAAVLVLGTAAGWWRQRTDGRLRSVGVPAGGGSASTWRERADPVRRVAAPGAAGAAAVAPDTATTTAQTGIDATASGVFGPGAAGSGAAGSGGASSGGAGFGNPGPGGVGSGVAGCGGASPGRPGFGDADVGGEGFGGAGFGGAGSVGAVPGRVGSGDAGTGGSAFGQGAIGAAAESDIAAASGADPSAAGERIAPELLLALGVQPARATLLQFSSAFCAPCRAVRRISAEVAELLPGVQHVEVDAESHLDAVRALGIWRTPTLLVLDADGRVAKRATGIPGKPQLIAALGNLLPTA